GIYQALQEATETRPGRKLKVVNLGLDPEEAAAMAAAGEVEVERVKPTKRKKPVAAYVAPEWAEWLQSNRVELNALSTPRFLAGLDAKSADHAGKVVPPAGVLTDRLAERVRATLRTAITRRVLAEAGVESLVEAELAERAGQIGDASRRLTAAVSLSLAENP